MRALEKNKTLSIMTLPDGKKTVGYKWVFTVKYNSDGSIERYKVWLIAKSFTQTYGTDYSDICSCCKVEHCKNSLAANLDFCSYCKVEHRKNSLAANLEWLLHQMDVKNAFFNGNMDEEIYMDIPPSFENNFGSNVCKQEKTLYGLKQSPRAWFEKFPQSIKK